MAREYAQRERRLIVEFLAGYAPAIKPIYNARLGPYPPSFAQKLTSTGALQQISPSQKYADAALIYPDHVELWEAKINLNGEAIGQLLVYRRAWPQTPEYAGEANKPVTLHIVAGYADPLAIAEAQAQGISVTLYTPQWLQQMAQNWPAASSQPIVGSQATATEQSQIKPGS
jgi:hypothetical protein